METLTRPKKRNFDKKKKTMKMTEIQKLSDSDF